MYHEMHNKNHFLLISEKYNYVVSTMNILKLRLKHNNFNFTVIIETL